jgi:hypothetical protein
MKHLAISLTVSLTLQLCFLESFAQKKLRSFENPAFRPGETLKFRVHYGIIDAGIVTLEVMKDMKNLGQRNCYHVIGKGFTSGAFDWVYKVRDHYESYIDAEAIIPWIFIRKLREGDYKYDEKINFNHFQNVAVSESGKFKTPDNVQDLISSFYYARCIDFSNAIPGEHFEVPAMLDTNIIPMRIKYVGKETITLSSGKYNCLKFKPLLQSGRVFKAKEEMTIWLSDDRNHIPVRLESKIIVGSIQVDLAEYSGLTNPIAKTGR